MRMGTPLLPWVSVVLILLPPIAFAQEPAGEDDLQAGRDELRAIGEIKSPEERLRRLREFLKVDPPEGLESMAEGLLFRTLREIDPKRVLEQAKEVLSRQELPDRRRSQIYVYKFLALRDLEDREAARSLALEILDRETSPSVLYSAAQFAEEHRSTLLEKAVRKREGAEPDDPSHPDLVTLYSFYARSLEEEDRLDEALKYMNKVVAGLERQLAEAEASEEEEDRERAERLRTGRLFSQYQSLARLLGRAGRPEEGLRYLTKAEEGFSDGIPIERVASFEEVRGELYGSLGRPEKALDSYIRTFAFRMDESIWERIRAAVEDRARDLRLKEARKFAPFELETPEGETKRLEDFLNRVTLVNFFFPT